MKRAISVLLALCLLCSFPMAALAEGERAADAGSAAIIDRVALEGASLVFVGGQMPVFTAHVPDGAPFTLGYEGWTDTLDDSDPDGKMFTSSRDFNENIAGAERLLGAFETGKTYYYFFTLELSESGARFAEHPTVILNGEERTGVVTSVTEDGTLFCDNVLGLTVKEHELPPFQDVDLGAYYAEAVQWAVENRVTQGKSRTSFAPDESCTRAQAVTFLWRAVGCPEPQSSENPFTDVKEDEYYTQAVLWAAEQGITDGAGHSAFSPNQPCTRAQIVTFLYRLAGEPREGIPVFEDLTEEWYRNAVAWAAWKNVTQGVSRSLFGPARPCTRAQIVTFLHRYVKMLEKAE